MSTKKDLSERDICTQFIIPAIKKGGWDIEKQIREEVFFTDGRIYVKGHLTARGKQKRADIILYYMGLVLRGIKNLDLKLNNLTANLRMPF
jgi:type I restriction enzyme R subunit